MDLRISLVGVAGLLALLLYRYIVYPALTSPLSRLPAAHPLCSITSRWFERQRREGRELKTLYAAHNRCGPIVRLGPNEVSVVSLDGLKQVYAAGLDKHPWYEQIFCNYGRQNLVCTLDHKTHSTIRKMIAGLYTKSYLHRSHDMDIICRRTVDDHLLPLLEGYARHGKDVEVMQLFECIGVDQVTAYLFGTRNSTNFIDDEVSREKYFSEWEKLRRSPSLQAKPITDELFMSICKKTLAERRDGESLSSESQHLVFCKLYDEMSARSKAWNMSQTEVIKRCASEVVDHVIATQETNTITWTYILWRLSLHPDLQEELRTELLTLEPPIILHRDKKRDLPIPSDIDALPLLNAVVYETLRLHAANPAQMPRVAPAAGLSLHDYTIPAGTKISTNAYCLHRNPKVFPEPLEWLPERWLSADDGKGKGVRVGEMRRWFWAFGSGPRMCLGQHFAMQVIKLVVAAIYSNYTTSIIDDDGIEQADAYNSAPVSHRLMLRFSAVDDIRNGA